MKNGCTKDEIREVLLQVALYCGIPASLDAHNMAVEIFAEESGTLLCHRGSWGCRCLSLAASVADEGHGRGDRSR